MEDGMEDGAKELISSGRQLVEGEQLSLQGEPLALILSKVRAVICVIADRESAERWEAVARLRLFCEGATSSEELEEIGSRKVNTLKVLVELLEELSPALGTNTTKAQVLEDVVWLLERLLCSVTLNHKILLKQTKAITLLLHVLARASVLRAPVLHGGSMGPLEPAANVLCCLTFHSSRACHQVIDANGCEAIAAATRACLGVPAGKGAGGAQPKQQPAGPVSPPALGRRNSLVAPDRERLACSLFELVVNLCSMLPQAQDACEATGLFALFLDRAATAVRALPDPPPVSTADPAGSAAAEADLAHASAGVSIVTEQLLLALNSVVWCNQRNQTLLCESETLDALLAHVFVWYSWTTQSGAHRSRLPPSYLASLLVVLGAQLDNETVIGAVARTAHERTLPALAARLGGALPRLCPLADFVTLHHLLLDQLLDIRHNHQHAEVVAEALGNARWLVRHCSESHYLFVHMHGALSVEMLLRCLGNVDETVLDAACSTAAAILHGSRRTQALFLRKHGIAVLRECALDYNADIQVRSLQLLAMLAHAHPACRHELRDEGVLRALLRSVQAYPYETELQVLEPTLDLISHAVTECARNQSYVREISGLGALCEALVYVAKAFCSSGNNTAAGKGEGEAGRGRGEARPAPISTDTANVSPSALSASPASLPADEYESDTNRSDPGEKLILSPGTDFFVFFCLVLVFVFRRLLLLLLAHLLFLV
ncbi:hypothetical protein T492DRAFT_1088329 [Pavlovales sp. CCMP2436]|nr:hypothetical protein T492DRAFT_1088329 [Pavlovales sp. CCMP2436]